jgi:serine protease Do
MTRGRVVRIAWALAALGVALMCREAGADAPGTIARVKASVVAIGTYERTRTPPFQFLASGFAVGDGTLIVTSAHLLPQAIDPAHAGPVAVLSPAPPRDGREQAQMRDARAIAIDATADLALLKIDGPPLPALRLRDSDTVRDGQDVQITGFPLGAVFGPVPVTHRGMIAAITPIAVAPARAADVDTTMLRRLSTASFGVFQLDATAYAGSSGSPVYDPETGDVLGIVNVLPAREAKAGAQEQPAGMPYAVPSRQLKALLDRPR